MTAGGGLDLHECAVTRIAEERVLSSAPFIVLRGSQAAPPRYFLLATATDCEAGCSLFTKRVRRAL